MLSCDGNLGFRVLEFVFGFFSGFLGFRVLESVSAFHFLGF